MKLIKTFIYSGIAYSTLILSIPARPQNKVAPVSIANHNSLSVARAEVVKQSQFEANYGLLRGLKEIRIVTAPNYPISRANLADKTDLIALKTAIEQKCRMVGLKVTDSGDWKTPILSVGLKDLYEPKDGRMVLVVSIEVHQAAILVANMRTRFLATTFACDRLESIGELKEDKRQVRDGVLKCLQLFLDEWEKENRS